MELKKLTEICSPKQWKTISQTEMLPEGYPVYGANGIIGYYNEYNHENPTVLITCRGATCGTLNISKPFSYVNGNAMALDNVIEDVDEKYLYYYLQSRGLKDIISGSAQPQITIQNLTKVIVSYPSIEEQKRIVSMLDKADEIRAKKKLANDKLDEFLKSTFISMFGDPVRNEKNFKKDSFGAGITTLSDYHANGSYEILRQHVELLSKPDYALMIRTTDLENKNYTDDVNYITEEAYNFLEKSKIYGGEIIINKIGSAGKVYFMPNLNRPVSLGMNAFLLRFNENLLNNVFTYYMLISNSVTTEIQKRVKGAVTKTITKDAVREIPIIYPPMELQNKFAKIVEHVEAQKQKNELVIEQMNNLFNSLSQRAFKGELAQSSSVDLITKQTVLHAKIIDKCNSHQTFGAVKMEKIFNLCDMSQELNLVPGGYYRKAAGPYVPEMRHSVEEKLAQNNWVKTINKGNGKKVEFKKDTKFAEYKNLYSEIFKDYEEQINKIIDYFYDKDTDYCEAFSTLYMCWNDLILEGKNPSKFEIIDEFKNHWAPEKQRFERIYLLEILSDMSNNHFEPHGQGLHTIDSEYNVNKDQLNLQLN